MIVWQRLAFGTLVAAGLVYTGVSVYQGATRRHTEPVEIVDTLEAIQERYLALRTTPPTVVTITNRIAAWDPDGSGYVYARPNGTNAPGSTNYLAWSGMSNDVFTFTNYGFRCDVTSIVHVGRFIWSGWDALAISTALGPAGTYHVSEQSVAATYYTNRVVHGDSVWVLVDLGYDHGWRLAHYTCNTGVPVSTWNAAAGTSYVSTQHVHRSFSGGWARESDGVHASLSVIPVGTINTNRLADAPAVVKVVRPNAVMAGASRQLQGALEAAVMTLIPQYVDDSLMSNGTFDAWFSVHTNASDFPRNTVTGLFARLAIGDGTNKLTQTPGRFVPAHTNWVYTYTNYWPGQLAHPICYTAEAWRAANYASAWDGTNYTWATYTSAVPDVVAACNVPPTFGDLPMIVTTNRMMELGRLVAALKVTASPVSWGTGVVVTASAARGYESGYNPLDYTPSPLSCSDYWPMVEEESNEWTWAQANWAVRVSTNMAPRLQASILADGPLRSRQEITFHNSPGDDWTTVDEVFWRYNPTASLISNAAPVVWSNAASGYLQASVGIYAVTGRPFALWTNLTCGAGVGAVTTAVLEPPSMTLAGLQATTTTDACERTVSAATNALPYVVDVGWISTPALIRWRFTHGTNGM